MSRPRLVLAMLAALVLAPAAAMAQTYLIEVQHGGDGTVSPANDYVYVAAGDSARLEFTPGDCSTIAYVEVDNASVGVVTSYTFRDVHEDHLVYVSFVPATYTITATATPGGYVLPAGTALVPCGSTVAYDIQSRCTELVDVVVDGVSVGVVSRYTFTNVRANHSLQATFGVGASTISLVMQPAVGLCSESPQVHIHVNGSTAGIVTVYADGEVVLSGALTGSDGTATLARPLSVGSHTLVAKYDGGTCNFPSQSDPVTYTVVRPPGVLQLAATPARGDGASRVTAALTVAGIPALGATGNVTFRDGAAVLGTVPVVQGVATLSFTPPDLAVHTITARYNGDPCIDPVDAASVTVALVPATGGVYVESSRPTAPYGTPVQYAAYVLADGAGASWATGHVDFLDNGAPLGTAVVNAGVAVWTELPEVGVHTITASYSGEMRLTPGSDELSQTVTRADPVIDIVAGPVAGLQATITVSITPASATGTVTLRDDRGTFAVVTLEHGAAQAPYTAATFGRSTLYADYSGDAHVAARTVAKDLFFSRLPTSLQVTSAMNPALAGQSVTFSARVTPAAATGTIEFSADGYPFDTVPLAGGVATIAYTLPLDRSSVRITGRYSGDAVYDVSIDGVTEQIVSRLATAITLPALPSPVLAGTALDVDADVFPVPPGASLTFSDGPTLIATIPVVNGRATLHWAPAIGHHNLIAAYGGNASYAPSSAARAFDVVAQLPTTTTITSPINPVEGRTAQLTVAVNPAPPVGSTVDLADDDGAVATLPLVNNAYSGTATYTYRTPALGVRHLTASFAGNPTYRASTDNLAITFALTTPAMTFTATPNPVFAGAAVTLSVAVAPTSATGTITFRDDTGSLGTVALAAGVATLTRTFTAAGTRALQAEYSGDTTFAAKTVATYLDVEAAPVQVGLVASAPVSFAGDDVRLTASTPGADGRVTFFLDGVSRAVVPVGADGSASFVTHTLAVGDHTASALYDGGASHAPGTSATLALTVLDPPPRQLRILAPNGGETWLVGSAMEIRWTQVPPPVTKVDLYVSRVLPPAWEPLALGVPNTGSYVWTVGAPGTNVAATPNETAMIAVIDPSGQAGSDASDLPFSIVDLATPAALERFEATGVETGVRLTWSAAAEAFAAVALERADAAAGPWCAVDADVHRDGDATVADDRTAAPGRKYWYRLVATTASGSAATFGPVRVTAGGVLAFAFAAPAPNPARGAVALSLALPEAARVRVAIADIAGREVAVVTDGAMTVGRHTLAWDGRDAHGAVAPGLYFVTCRAGANRAVRRLVVAR